MYCNITEILVGAIEYVWMNNNKNELVPMTNMQITYHEVAKGQAIK